MGILQQMVHILNQLDPHNTYLKNQALKQVQDEANAVANDVSALDDKMEKMRETLRLFDDTVTRPDYARKLLLIENSIYGVDIQPVAVQIAKLRFFISLVVEQTAKDDIRPLPNLETNFVAANTLIGITKPKDTFFADDPQVADIEKALKANRHRHFFARTTRTKLACRKEDKRLRDALQQRLVDLATKPDETVIAENLALIQKLETDRTNYLTEKWEKRERQEQTDLFGTTAPEQQTLSLRVDINKAKRDKIDSDIRHCRAAIDAERAKAKNNAFTKEAQKLALWDPYDQNATSGFFDPEWMFGITAGFDIVIGNPPYYQLQNNGGELADLYKDRGFESYARTATFTPFSTNGRINFSSATPSCVSLRPTNGCAPATESPCESFLRKKRIPDPCRLCRTEDIRSGHRRHQHSNHPEHGRTCKRKCVRSRPVPCRRRQ
jgi:hypothetical protein